MQPLKFHRLSEKAVIPKWGSKLAAGFDLYSAVDCVVSGSGKTLVPTDLQISLPDNCYGRISPLDGLALNNHIGVGAGIIDEDYRGNIGVILFKNSEGDFQIKIGDKIALLVIEKIDKLNIKCHILSKEAIIPTRGTKLSAGLDLYSSVECLVPAGGCATVSTDIKIDLPNNCCGIIAPRSGLAWKHHIDIGAGVIDQDFHGNLSPFLINLSKKNFKIEIGDRIAQLICLKIFSPIFLIEKGLIQFHQLSDKATIPKYGNKFSAGFVLFSAVNCIIPAGAQGLVTTDIQIYLPDNCYGRISPMNELALKHSIYVVPGPISQDYKGNVGVVLFNKSKKDFEIRNGDRVAQLICGEISRPELVDVEILDETERGSNGYGSTGRN